MSKRTASEQTTKVSIVPLAPSREELETLVNNVPELLRVIIKNESQYQATLEEFKAVGEAEKKLREKKDSVLAPLKQATKNFNSMFKPYEDKIASVTMIYRNALNIWVQDRENQRRLELAKIESDKRLKNPATIQARLSTVTESSESTFNVDVVKVIDLKKIPLEYFILDEAKIKAAHKAGISIPGVEVVKEKRVRR